MLNHTAQRLFQRPDMLDYLDLLEDGAVLEMLWKWGIDGQTGQSVLSPALSWSHS